mmetsp:Transcript_1863/g.4279  ORF Transcript_1863/g.4279 Transcript_1863/m.4279 type:complete len:1394 (-) Transcript_1863:144-4325(-)
MSEMASGFEAASGPVEAVLKVHECRNLVDKGSCMSYCVCKVSIVRQSYENLEEEVLGRARFISAPTYRHKLKLAKLRVWKQTASKECSIHWSKHDHQGFKLSFDPGDPSGGLCWGGRGSGNEGGKAGGGRKEMGRREAEAGAAARAGGEADEEAHWHMRNKPRIKFEVYAVGSPSAPKEKFLGQAYLSWDEMAANVAAGPESNKLFLALKPRSFKSRVKGYFVVSLDSKDALSDSAKTSGETMPPPQMLCPDSTASTVSRLGIEQRLILRSLGTYMKKMSLYCQVERVENLQAPESSISSSADPYVMLRTLPECKYSRTGRTGTHFQTSNATFAEAFLFSTLRPEIQDLCVSVWDENTGSEDTCLGHITIPLEMIWHAMINAPAEDPDSKGRSPEAVEEKIRRHTMAFELQQRKKALPARGGNGPGIVHLSLWFGTREETLAACASSKRKVPGNTGDLVLHEPELSTLHLEIIQAKNVPPKILKNRQLAGRDCYCTVSLTGCVQKNSTAIQRSTLWPEFNEKFALKVAKNQLHRASDGTTEGGEGGGGGKLSKTAAAEGSDSHRCQDCGYNDQGLLSLFKKSGTDAPILTIKMYEYDPLNQSLGGDKCLGKIKVPVSNLPTESGLPIKPQWIPLKRGKGRRSKYGDLVPELFLRACFEQEDALPERDRTQIGSLSITLRKAYLETGVADLASERGGLYCLLKYGREFVKSPCHQMTGASKCAGRRSTPSSFTNRPSHDSARSEGGLHLSQSSATYRSCLQTERSEGDIYSNDDSLKVNQLQIFAFGDKYMFPVSEPASLLTVGIFDKADMKLSKIEMKLSTFLRRSNKMLYPITVDMPDKKGPPRHVGYLEFSITIQYFSKMDLWTRYFTLTRPPIDYTNPLPWKAQYNLLLQSHDLVKAYLVKGSSPSNKLASAVAKDMLETEDLKFSVKTLQTRFADISESLRNLIPVDFAKIELYDPLSWERPALSALVVAMYCFAIQYAEYLLPLIFLVLVIAGLSLRKFQREIICSELSRLSKSEAGEEGAKGGPTRHRHLHHHHHHGAARTASKLRLNSPIRMGSSGNSKTEDNFSEDESFEEDISAAHCCIPDVESDTFRVDCFWQDSESEPGSSGARGPADTKRGSGGRGGAEREKKLLRVKRKVEILKLDVEDKFLTVKAKAGDRIQVFKLKMGDKVDGVKVRLDDKLEHINRALRSKFPNVRLKLSGKLSRSLRRNVKGAVSEVREKAGKVKDRVGQAVSEVIAKANNAIDGAKGLARKEIETKLLAARRRANVVVLMDKYLQLKKQYEELKSFAGISQMFLGDFNKSLQNVRGLVLWTDPRVSFFFVFGCFALSLFLFFCGMKCTLQLAGLYLFRPPCLRNPFPPLPFQPFYRLSSIQESPLWCYMKIQHQR